MGLGRDRGLNGGGRQQIAAMGTEEEFSLFADAPATTVASSSSAGPSNSSGVQGQADLAAQIAQLTTLLAGFSNAVNKPQGF